MQTVGSYRPQCCPTVLRSRQAAARTVALPQGVGSVVLRLLEQVTAGTDGRCVCRAGLRVVCLHQLSCWPAHPLQSSSFTCFPSSQHWHAAVRRQALSWHRQEHRPYCCRWWRWSHCHEHRYGRNPACHQLHTYRRCAVQSNDELAVWVCVWPPSWCLDVATTLCGLMRKISPVSLPVCCVLCR
jgi:hypothetical protein